MQAMGCHVNYPLFVIAATFSGVGLLAMFAMPYLAGGEHELSDFLTAVMASPVLLTMAVAITGVFVVTAPVLAAKGLTLLARWSLPLAASIFLLVFIGVLERFVILDQVGRIGVWGLEVLLIACAVGALISKIVHGTRSITQRSSTLSQKREIDPYTSALIAFFKAWANARSKSVKAESAERPHPTNAPAPIALDRDTGKSHATIGGDLASVPDPVPTLLQQLKVPCELVGEIDPGLERNSIVVSVFFKQHRDAESGARQLVAGIIPALATLDRNKLVELAKAKTSSLRTPGSNRATPLATVRVYAAAEVFNHDLVIFPAGIESTNWLVVQRRDLQSATIEVARIAIGGPSTRSRIGK